MPLADGEKIRELRHNVARTKTDLANASGVSVSTITRAESGENIGHRSVLKISRGLSSILGRKISLNDIMLSHSKIRSRGEPRLSELLERTNLTIEQLAEQLRLSPSTISRWRSGKSKPDERSIRLIMDILGVTAAEMEAYGLSTPESLPEERPTPGDKREVLARTAKSIPDQNPLIRFGVSENNKLRLVPSLSDENDYDTISALRSELLAASGPIPFLKDRYARNPNTPQAGLFGPLTSRYDDELSKVPKDINYAVLYARGARFYAARIAANRQVASGEWPELDADEAEAIDAICDLHGPLVMASAVGRRLISDAHEYETTPEVARQEEQLIQEFGEVLATETEIIEPETAEAISDLTTPIENDPQPARSRGVRLLVTGSALVSIVGGVAWLSAGGAAATVAVPLILATGGSMFLWEVVKQTDDFKKARDGLAAQYDAATKHAAERSSREQISLLNRMNALVERQKQLFRNIARLRPEFRWAERALENKHSTSILIIDDYKEITDSFSKTFDRAGYRVKVANDLRTAYELVNNEKFDLVIFDPSSLVPGDINSKNLSIKEDMNNIISKFNSIDSGFSGKTVILTAHPSIDASVSSYENGVRELRLKKDVRSGEKLLKEIQRIIEG